MLRKKEKDKKEKHKRRLTFFAECIGTNPHFVICFNHPRCWDIDPQADIAPYLLIIQWRLQKPFLYFMNLETRAGRIHKKLYLLRHYPKGTQMI